jgi:hypothetical protein
VILIRNCWFASAIYTGFGMSTSTLKGFRRKKGGENVGKVSARSETSVCSVPLFRFEVKMSTAKLPTVKMSTSLNVP